MSTAAPSTQPAATDSSRPNDAATDDAASVIGTLREQIDALDTAIARLVLERTKVSKRIQAARINSGGTRIELGRERAVIDHYRDTLGADGAIVADAVLRAGRGAR
ncbi:MAG: chorismate mutase [Actinobacteria bacterium]|nr:chorismate mutase [Actinomycetota bacterium]